MCGLFGGMSSILSKDEIYFISQLGVLSMFRGQDSTGISVAYRPEGEEKKKLKSELAFHHKKTLETAPEFFNNPDSYKPLEHKQMVSVLGHTRAATLGDVVVKNAHPHWYKHIIGTHNGTIPSLNRTDEQKKMGSDSVNLFRGIANEGLVPVLKNVHGAYALAYYDVSDCTLNFVRNDQRTLYYMYTKGKTTMYWASERRMLEYIRATSYEFDEVRPFRTGVHYKCKLGSPRYMEETELELRPLSLEWLRRGRNTETTGTGSDRHHNVHVWDHETQKLIPKQEYLELKRSRQETMPMGDYINQINAECDAIRAGEMADKKVLLPPSHHTTVPQIGWTKDYQVSNSVILSIEEAQARLADGCTNCRSQATIEDDTYWLNSSEWFCEDCKDQEFVKEYVDKARLTKGKVIHVHTVD